MSDGTLNRFLSRGTAAQRAAFTPTPPTPASGPSPGYVWYETDTGLLYAYDGSAWDRISAGAQLDCRFVRKTANESVTSSLTLQDDDHLVLAIGASETWVFQTHLFYEASTGGDLKTAYSLPSGATGVSGSHRPEVNITTTIGSGNWNAQTDFTTPGQSIAGGVGAGTVLYKYETLIVVNSTNAGNVTLRWAQNTSDGTATILRANSCMIGYRFA